MHRRLRAASLAPASQRLPGWTLDLVWLRLELSKDAYTVSWRDVAPERGWWRTLVLALLAVYLLLFVVQLPKFEFWGRFATIDEQLQYYQVARNFDRYGFITNALLPDLSTGASPSQHPYLYNHQPPGPQLVIALLMRLFGEHFVLVRMVFAAVFVAGVFSFLAFARVLARQGIHGVEAALLVVRPDVIMHSIDHPAYSAFPLFAFLPLVALDRHRQTGRGRWLLAAAALVFVGSNYLIYGPLFMAFVLWVLGAWLGFLPGSRRPLMVVAGAAVLAIGAHLLQTPLALGWPVFAKELWFTVSNRLTGEPTREELVGFYRSVHIVLYGEHVFSLRHFAKAVFAALSGCCSLGGSPSWFELFPGGATWAMAVASAVVVGTARGGKWAPGDKVLVVSREIGDVARRLGTLALWIGGAILTPFLMFPAFSSDYGLNGTNEFLLGILAVGGIGMAAGLAQNPRLVEVERTIVRVLLVVCVLGIAMPQAAAITRTTLRVAKWVVRPSAEAAFLEVAAGLRGEVVMTNVDPAVVGFFTRELALGGCQRKAVPSGRVVPEACQVYFVRGFPGPLKLRPTAFVWVGSGNMFCTPPNCIEPEDLARLYDTRFSSSLVKVFDLAQPPSRRAAAGRR